MDRNKASDVIIVGSGPAGVAAALGFSQHGIVPTILDIGREGPSEICCVKDNFYEYAEREEVSDMVLGKNFEGIYYLNDQNKYMSYYLTVPKHRYVAEGSDELLPLDEHNTAIVQSIARGGLANAWGCAAYRYLDRDLKRFPLTAKDLEPHYDSITQEIGVNGEDDDLTPFNGPPNHLQPAFKLAINSEIVLKNYQQRKHVLNSQNMYVGRMRSAILTRDLGERKANTYQNNDLFDRVTCNYNPIYTLEKLIREDKVHYIPDHLVQRWSKKGETIFVHATELANQSDCTFRCKNLILGAGTVNSTRITLRSFHDYQTKLRLMDNPTTHIPLLLRQRIGRSLDIHGYGSCALAAVFDFDQFATPLHGLFFETMLCPRAEFFRHMPFNASFNAKVVKYLLPAMVVLVLFFPSDPSRGGTVGLSADGKLQLHPPARDNVPPETVKRVIRLCRKLGLYSHHSLSDRLIHGGSIHYVGTLGMQARPTSKYHTDINGELRGAENVYVVDGAALPALSSKNHTLTIMANSLRICSQVGERLRQTSCEQK